MNREQILQTNPDEFLRCEEGDPSTYYEKSPSPIQRSDAVTKENIDQALWKDTVLRARDYFETDVQVKNGTVYLSGHIRSTTNQSRIKNALRTVPGILDIKNNLVLDDQLTIEVAVALGKLEHTHGCKFFTGTSHGVVYLSGIVSDENVKWQAQKCAASHPKVRGVINQVRVAGAEVVVDDQVFIQPTIGEIIYFLDRISGVVKQVIINPNDRRVTAMTIAGHFYDLQPNPALPANSIVPLPEQLLVIPMKVMGHLTTSSGFLTIPSTDFTKYQLFDASLFTAPHADWWPPYPYCRTDVLLPVENQLVDNLSADHLPYQSSTMAKLESRLLSKELLVNDSLGG